MNTNTLSFKGYQNLNVWKESHQLVILVYKATQKFPKEELFGLTSQLRRAAVSVVANLVEGYARSSKKELLQFLSISIGSLAEVEYYLYLAHEITYLENDEFFIIEEKRRIVGNLLHGFLLSVKSKTQ